MEEQGYGVNFVEVTTRKIGGWISGKTSEGNPGIITVIFFFKVIYVKITGGKIYDFLDKICKGIHLSIPWKTAGNILRGSRGL